jgi:hypothetical protein
MHNVFLLSSKRDPAARTWDIHAEAGDSFPGAVDFARVMAILDAAIGPRGLTFLATDDVGRIPVDGDDVVVFVHEDEWCRVPAYANRVRAVFKTFGSMLKWAANPFTEPSARSLLSSIQDVRTEIARIPSYLYAARGDRTFDLPLGYCRQLDRIATPINDRRYDIYFGGTVKSQRAFKQPWLAAIDTPKNQSRSLMLASLERLRDAHPELKIESSITQTFHDLPSAQIEHYSETMLATKICLVPRGSNLETWRYFEGLRYGCAIVAERLPSRWYYDGAPIERVESWDELEEVVLRLLRDPAALQRRQDESLAWWRDVCSEPTIARHIARCLFEGSDASKPRSFVVRRTT